MKLWIVLLAAVVYALFGGDLKASFNKAEAIERFKEFTQVTSVNFPDAKLREAEMRRLVTEAERSFGSKCSVLMIARNSGSVYRRDQLKFTCGTFSKPGPSLPLTAEYVHKTGELEVY